MFVFSFLKPIIFFVSVRRNSEKFVGILTNRGEIFIYSLTAQRRRTKLPYVEVSILQHKKTRPHFLGNEREWNIKLLSCRDRRALPFDSKFKRNCERRACSQSPMSVPSSLNFTLSFIYTCTFNTSLLKP